MIDQRGVELGSLVYHILKLSLGLQGHINPVQELLPVWVNLNGILEHLELIPSLFDHVVSGLDEILLTCDSLEALVVGLFFFGEDLIFGRASGMDGHEFLDHIKIGKLLNKT